MTTNNTSNRGHMIFGMRIYHLLQQTIGLQGYPHNTCHRSNWNTLDSSYYHLCIPQRLQLYLNLGKVRFEDIIRFQRIFKFVSKVHIVKKFQYLDIPWCYRFLQLKILPHMAYHQTLLLFLLSCSSLAPLLHILQSILLLSNLPSRNQLKFNILVITNNILQWPNILS